MPSASKTEGRCTAGLICVCEEHGAPPSSVPLHSCSPGRMSSPGCLRVASAPLHLQDLLLGRSHANLPSRPCVTLSWQAARGRARTREALIAAGGCFRNAFVPGKPHFLVPSVLGTSKETHPEPTLWRPPSWDKSLQQNTFIPAGPHCCSNAPLPSQHRCTPSLEHLSFTAELLLQRRLNKA